MMKMKLGLFSAAWAEKERRAQIAAMRCFCFSVMIVRVYLVGGAKVR
jgi:hypothetical protein